DYFELLRRAASEVEEEQANVQRDHRHEGFEDIYSHSEPPREYEDVSSYSSEELRRQDRGPSAPPPRPAARPQQTRTRDHAAPPPRRPADTGDARPVRRPPDVDEEELSDYDVRYHRVPGAKKKKRHGFLRFVAVLLVLCLVGGTAFTLYALHFADSFREPEKITHFEGAALHHEPFVRNVLLIGLDKAQGGKSRSDSIMLVSVNKKTGRVVLTSVMRDTHVQIADENVEAKINSAYVYGTANCLVRTVEMNFGIRVDDYALVDFNMFSALVDGIGGIEVDLTEGEADYINEKYAKKYPDGDPLTVYEGKDVHLVGWQALIYARTRKISSDSFGDGDFGRTGRQRYLIEKILQKARTQFTPSGIPKLLKTARAVAPYIETTLSKTELLRLGFMLAGCFAKSGFDFNKLVVSQRLPFDGYWTYSSEWDGSSLEIDFEKNRDLLYRSIYVGDNVAEETADAETTEFVW
ncbi:MAG: LCP family protein, partial [Clostridia bacterium]|nr:LCP family protein [Clostridia bacterium]